MKFLQVLFYLLMGLMKIATAGKPTPTICCLFLS